MSGHAAAPVPGQINSTQNYVWNTNTLAWEAMTQPGSSAGGSVTLQGDAEITTLSGGYVYTARAVPGASTSTAAWQVTRTALVDPFITTWADGNQNFDNQANNLAGLTYS